MKIPQKSAVILLGAASLAFSMPSNAATLTFTDSIGDRLTNWSDTFSVSQFDPALGALISATVLFEVASSGRVDSESLDASPTTLAFNIGANGELTGGGLTGTIEVNPLAAGSFNATAFDAVVDFAGSSGTSLAGLNDTKSEQAVLTGGDLAPYIGNGSITFDVSVVADSSASGAGNLITAFSNSAAANVSVTYEYAEPVPEPSSVAMLAVGCAALLGRRRRV